MPAPTPRDRVRAIVAEITEVDPARLRPETDLAGELGLDSPKALRLLCRVEEALEIEIPEEAPPRFETLGDLLDYVDRLAASAAREPA